jgi:hypothetical protein
VSLALVSQHAKHMCHTIVSSVAIFTLPYFSTSSKNGKIFGKITEHKKCVLIFSMSCAWNTSHSQKNSVSYHHKCTQVFRSSARYSTSMFSTDFWKTYKYKISWKTPSFKIRVIQCVCAWKQADVLKPIAALRNFENATKKGHSYPNRTLPLRLVQDLSSPPFQWY